MFDDLTLDELVERIGAVEQTVSTQRSLLDDLKMSLMDRMNEAGIASTVTAAGKRITVVRSRQTRWDADILKDVLAPLGMWERVRVLREDIDEAALERLVDAGDVDLARLQPALEVVERKPYPKISNAKKQHDA